MMGKGDRDTAEKIIGNCTTALVIISVILTVLVLMFGEKMLMTFGASENTINYALDYLNIYACGTIFVQIALGLNAFITAQGFAKMSMITQDIFDLLDRVVGNCDVISTSVYWNFH